MKQKNKSDDQLKFTIKIVVVHSITNELKWYSHFTFIIKTGKFGIFFSSVWQYSKFLKLIELIFIDLNWHITPNLNRIESLQV